MIVGGDPLQNGKRRSKELVWGNYPVRLKIQLWLLCKQGFNSLSWKHNKR
jgi:hypothetical protein